MQSDQIEYAVELIANSRYLVALTGAGISTPSGIPDFRSPGSGVWEKTDPSVATLSSFRHDPRAFYDWIRPLVRLMLDARPNPAHIALARLEEMGLLKELITQNIDTLHHKAGSKIVHEVHGHIRDATCIRCYSVYPSDEFMDTFLETGAVPKCPRCGGTLKPNVILFGEQLPMGPFLAAKKAAQKCDVMLVAGSSLEVAPAGQLPLMATVNGAKLIIINLAATYMDEAAELVIRGDVAEVLPRIVKALEADITI